jgi:hypothetical protein
VRSDSATGADGNRKILSWVTFWSPLATGLLIALGLLERKQRVKPDAPPFRSVPLALAQNSGPVNAQTPHLRCRARPGGAAQRHMILATLDTRGQAELGGTVWAPSRELQVGENTHEEQAGDRQAKGV